LWRRVPITPQCARESPIIPWLWLRNNKSKSGPEGALEDFELKAHRPNLNRKYDATSKRPAEAGRSTLIDDFDDPVRARSTKTVRSFTTV
jgi:hypothetical protein